MRWLGLAVALSVLGCGEPGVRTPEELSGAASADDLDDHGGGPADLAVVDRIVELPGGRRRLAVLLVGDEQRERRVSAEQLPAGAVEGSWLRVRFRGEALVDAALDEDRTRAARQRVRARRRQLLGD